MAELELPRVVEPMTPNTTVENISPSLKRKITEDDLPKSKTMLGLDGAVDKKPKLDAAPPHTSLVQLQGRKVVFKQDPLPKITPSRRQNLAFETLLVDAEEENRTVKEIPDELWGVIVMAGIESTARTEGLFVKQLKSALTSKVDDGRDLLPIDTLTPLVSRLFTRRDYGFIPSDFSPSSTVKVPATLQIRCWEANEPEKYLSGDQLDMLETRKAERTKAREECLRFLIEMDDVGKLDFIKGDKIDRTEKGDKKNNPKDNGEIGLVKMDKESDVVTPRKMDSPQIEIKRKSREGTANTVGSSRRSMSPVQKSKMTPEEEEAARVRMEEKEARKAARAEKKAAEEREEEKRKAAMAKQAHTMSAFFKPKTVVSPVVSRESPAGPSCRSPVRNASPPVMSDFARTFRPIPKRTNVQWAEINRWRRRSQSPPVSHRISGEDIAQWENGGCSSVQGWSAREFVKDHLERHKTTFSASRRRMPKGLKTTPAYGTVADVWNDHQDAADPRKVLEKLKNQRKYPWKTLAFDQQVRPPYCGTYTKKSVTVGPRTPFAQDPALDYTYDSGDDWQDDEGGEDVDDFGEGAAEPEDEGEDESEGEFDDWLDDSEDGGYVPAEGDEEIQPIPPSEEQSKLPMKVVKKRDVPRKVVKLTPVWRGPMWESKVGEGSDGMESYRLHLLNETPDTTDPFDYVSVGSAQLFKTSYSSTVIGTNLNVRCLLAADLVAEKKAAIDAAVSDPSAQSSLTTRTNLPNGGPASGVAPTKPRAAGPKAAFPDSHLPQLLQLIEGNTNIRSDLVSQLRGHFDSVTSKAAIEAKIKEVAVREGKAKDSQWRVRPEAWAACGGIPSAAVAQPMLVAQQPTLVDV